LILHPPIIALLAGSLLAGSLVLVASWHALAIVRHWDLQSGSERQLALERRTYLVSTAMAYTCAFQIVSLFLFIYTADDLAPLFVGAMCAAGTLFVNPFGYPTLLLKVAGAILAGVWLIVNHADHQARDYPLIRGKYVGLLVLAPVILADGAAQAAFFANLKADVITSCCGSLFGGTSPGVASQLASLPVLPMKVAFYIVTAALLFSCARYVRRSAGGYAVSILSVLGFVVAMAALISCFSLYIYELPTHHCPFCILQREYRYLGYPLYASLFAGVVSGTGLGLLYLRRETPSLRPVLHRITRRLALAALVSYGIFALIVTVAMVVTPFRLEGY